MKETPREYRMAKNEVVFRTRNEEIEAGFEEIKRLAREDDQEHMVQADDNELLFFCECSDENCHERIKMKPSRYKQLHKKKNMFTVICGHQKPKVEKIVRMEDDVCVVEKYMEPPASAKKLESTKDK